MQALQRAAAAVVGPLFDVLVSTSHFSPVLFAVLVLRALARVRNEVRQRGLNTILSGSRAAPALAAYVLCLLFSVSSSIVPTSVSWKSRFWIGFNRFLGKHYKRAEVVWEDEEHVKRQAKEQGRVFMAAAHPHGRLGAGYAFLLVLEPFQDFVILGSSDALKAPVFGWFARMGGIQPITAANMAHMLSSKQHIAILPGGVQEMLLCRPRSDTIHLYLHVGFLNMAMTHRALLLPIFSFAANDEYDSMFPACEQRTYERWGVPMPPVYVNRFGLPITNATTYKLVVGRPIDTLSYIAADGTRRIDELKAAYKQAVVALFEKHKASVPGFAHRRIQWHQKEDGVKGAGALLPALPASNL